MVKTWGSPHPNTACLATGVPLIRLFKPFPRLLSYGRPGRGRIRGLKSGTQADGNQAWLASEDVFPRQQWVMSWRGVYFPCGMTGEQGASSGVVVSVWVIIVHVKMS